MGIVAINILGTALPLPAGAIASGAGGPAGLDDLAMDMQFDSVTAAQIRQMHTAKVKAVQGTTRV